MRNTARIRHLLAVAALVLPVASALPVTGASATATGTATAGAGWHRLTSGPADSRDGASRSVRPDRAAHFALTGAALTGSATPLATLAEQAPAQPQTTPAAGRAGTVVELPTPEGTLARFSLRESPVMEPGLAAAHPDIRTYAGRGVDDPTATVRVDVGPLGLHASVRSTGGAWYVDPSYTRDRGDYLSYYGRDLRENVHGSFVERDGSGLDDAAAALGSAAPPISTGSQLRTYRLALLSDPTYANYFGAANVTAAKVALINRVDQIYEDDLAIRLVLIDGTDRLNLATPALASGPNGPCGSAACYPAQDLASCGLGTLRRNATVLGLLVGSAAYDIGHIALGTNGGGIAGLGVAGGRGKSVGCTGVVKPVGDYYAVDYVAHEMGHQFGANHTFNGFRRACGGGNRNGPTSVEPGSGSSIMAYAGICGSDDLQPHSDPYFSERSYTEIETYVASTRPAVSEVQTVALRDFSGSDSFVLTLAGQRSAPIVRGVNYTPAGIAAAIGAIPGVPAGTTVTVRGFAAGTKFGDRGFEVDFGGALAGIDIAPLGLADTQGVTGLVGEAVQGGPDDNQGHTVTPTGNSAPVVTAPAGYVVPVRTPFALTGSSTDADGDAVTYSWEQNDPGGTTGTALLDPDKTDGPLFRQFGRPLHPSRYEPTDYDSPGENSTTTDPTRVFPDLGQVLAGNTNALTGDCPGAPAPTTGRPSRLLLNCYSEFLPTEAYVGLRPDAPAALHFRLTARDGSPGGGGVAYADTTLTLARGSGPFLVTSQPAGSAYAAGSTQTVTWNVAGTDVAPVAAAQVRITLSEDGGRTWPVVLAAATANDGSAAVALPSAATGHARIRVEAVGNVFFAVNAADFAVTGH